MTTSNHEPTPPELSSPPLSETEPVPLEPALQAIVVHGANLILRTLLEQPLANDVATSEAERTELMMPRIKQAAQQAIQKLQTDTALGEQILRLDDDTLRDIKILHSLFGLTSLPALGRLVKKEPSFVVEALHQINSQASAPTSAPDEPPSVMASKATASSNPKSQRTRQPSPAPAELTDPEPTVTPPAVRAPRKPRQEKAVYPKKGEKALSALPENSPALLLSREVATIFHVSQKTVNNWKRAGILPGTYTVGGHLRFRREDVERLLAELNNEEVKLPSEN